MQTDRTRMLRVKTVAEMFDVSPQTIYRAIKSGRLDALKLGTGRAVRIPEYAVRAYMEECAEAAHLSYVVGNESVHADDKPGAEMAGEVR